MPRPESAERAAEFEAEVRADLRPDLEIVRRLGGGPMSTVFLAREPALQRLVAVKALHGKAARRAKGMARFRREAHALARVSHPNVVSIYRVGDRPDGSPYLVMQYVRGTTLADRLATRGPLAIPEGCRALWGIAGALSSLHSHQVVHRDVRPDSVLCDEAEERFVLADFGLAAFLAEESGTGRLTTAGHIVTDLAYSAPEVLQGEEPTSASDIYSLGLLAYDVLTGRGPYDASTAAARVQAHLRQPPLRLEARGLFGPPGLQELLDGCLAKNPTDRPSASQVALRFAELLGDARGEVRSAPSLAGSRRDRAGPVQPAIQLRLLGTLDLAKRGEPTPSIVRQPKRLALLAFLAVGEEGNYHRRDSLTALFWPDADQESARHSLRQALYVLRRALGPKVIRSRGDEEVGIDPGVMACDVSKFESLAGSGDAAEAMAQYGGDLLPGFYVDDAPDFERWLDLERLRLRSLAARQCWCLSAEAERNGDTGEASRRAQQAVDLNPFDERALHRLIELLDRAGDRAGALAAFDHFAHRLKAEYEVEPSPETVALVQAVRVRRR